MSRTTSGRRSERAADGAQRDREARAWGWVAHLRDGGTTPWSAWGSAAGADQHFGRYLPGAQQLELVRRLNQRRLPSPELADRILATSAPGRGRPDLGLVGVLPDSAFGPPPVDPAELPGDELVRVATALIAEDVVAAGDPFETRTPRLLRRRYRLLGDPELATPLRAALVADGRPPGGRRATVVVAGTDLASMLVHLWTARSLGAGVRPWRDWLRLETGRTGLPDRIDLAARAQEWVPRVGAGHVHVVLDDPRRVVRMVTRRRIAAVRPLSADAVELARRTAPVVGTLVTPERRTALMWHRLRPVLSAYPGPPLRPPPRFRDWLVDGTTDLRRRLATGDYAVHGALPDPAGGPADQPGVSAPDDERVLALAIQVLLGPPIGTPRSGRAAETPRREAE
ncbi:MAG TPA: hypothetical protein VGK78_12095 [Nocardioides sp.]|uniref:hypothetical protein n=1 Tax=Nocardioides sp. TaxID=35761 RepID=UPI002F41BB73